MVTSQSIGKGWVDSRWFTFKLMTQWEGISVTYTWSYDEEDERVIFWACTRTNIIIRDERCIRFHLKWINGLLLLQQHEESEVECNSIWQINNLDSSSFFYSCSNVCSSFIKNGNCIGRVQFPVHRSHNRRRNDSSWAIKGNGSRQKRGSSSSSSMEKENVFFYLK